MEVDRTLEVDKTSEVDKTLGFYIFFEEGSTSEPCEASGVEGA
jgi:hypothetical protein